MSIDSFFQSVCNKYQAQISGFAHKTFTDDFFLLIEGDASLMKDYVILVQAEGQRKVNAGIASRIQKKSGFIGGERCTHPIGTLITGYREFL